MEDTMQDCVVAYMTERGHSLCAREYDVVDGRSQYGKGDLWFRLKNGVNLVVETKVRHPAMAHEQAARYAAWVAIKTDARVAYATYVKSAPLPMSIQLSNMSIMDPVRAKTIIRHFFDRKMGIRISQIGTGTGLTPVHIRTVRSGH